MTSPMSPLIALPDNSFSAEDATEQALAPAFRQAVGKWLAISSAAALASGRVPDLSMLYPSSTFAADAVEHVGKVLRDTWAKTYARTGTDLRPFIDTYLRGLFYRLDGLVPLANRRASQALADKAASGDMKAMRKAVGDALALSGYDGYVNRLASTEAAIAVNAARHDIAQAAYRAGAQINKIWHTREDPRVRVTHAVARGQNVPFNSPFWVGGLPMQHPGDPSAPPSEVCNCRCRVEYVTSWGRR